jgi:hypothetical protein
VPEPSAKFEKPPLPPEPPTPIIRVPQKSERLGIVLGVDLGFEEPALSVSRDNRMPRASIVITTAARNIIRFSKTGEKVETIAIFGSMTDPTLHPDIREITSNLRDLRNKWYPKAKLWFQSEDPHFDTPDVRLALGVFDRVLVRFDWGTVKHFSAATGRKGPELAGIQAALTNLESLIVQARFGKGEGGDNSVEAEVKAWIKRMGEVRPREIHLPGADAKSTRAKFKSVPKTRLGEIAAEVTEKAGVPVVVCGHESILG